MVSWAHPRPQPKWHLDRFSRFCRAHYCHRQIDRPTDRPHYSLRNNRPHLRIVVLRRGLKIVGVTASPVPPGSAPMARVTRENAEAEQRDGNGGLYGPAASSSDSTTAVRRDPVTPAKHISDDQPADWTSFRRRRRVHRSTITQWNTDRRRPGRAGQQAGEQ